MYKKSVTVRLPKDVLEEIEKLTKQLLSKNRTLVIEYALRYALKNPPAGGLLSYNPWEDWELE